jgi:hypothetical protein
MEVVPGDIVLHFCKGAVRALGHIAGPPYRARLPEGSGEEWERDCYQAPVKYFELQNPIALREIPEDLRKGE